MDRKIVVKWCWVFLTGVFVLLFTQCTDRLSSHPLHEKKILFIGNSITYAGAYLEYIEAAIRAKDPGIKLNIVNVGLPSETVSGLSEEGHADGAFPRPDLRERLDRVLDMTKPDFVFTCYGINDGIYQPFDQGRFQAFKEGILWMTDEIENLDIQHVHITPPVYDGNEKSYIEVMDTYSDWLISNRKSKQWEVIDVYWPMKNRLEKERAVDRSFTLSTDGVHPNTKGHFIMAQQILKYLGYDEYSKAQSIDDVLIDYENGGQIFSLIESRHQLMKDAWLTHIGHTRPSMKKGLPLDQAQQKADEINEQLLKENLWIKI